VTSGEQEQPAGTETEEPASLTALLDYLKRNRGFDFTGYKRSSLERRIQRRMQEVELDTYEEYQDFLEVNPDEFTDLFNTILINVTGFFRDKPAWDYLGAEIIPAVIESVPKGEPIRLWSAACATGEEAYTLAIMFAEALGEDEFRRRVKVYATDVDEEALTRARQAVYTRDALKALPDGLAERYFETTPLGQMFRADLRRSVIFGRNDLVQDAPISKIDLLVSRNALMYFTPEAQARILSHFNFALRDTGFLFLGKSEMLITHADLFTPHSLGWRVFKRVPRRGLRDRLAFVTTDNGGGDFERVESYGELRAGALDVAHTAMVVIDSGGFVNAVNQTARDLFGIASADIGRPFQDLELSYRPVDLRTALAQVYAGNGEVSVGRVEWIRAGGRTRTFQVKVQPIPGDGAHGLGATISFEDVTEVARLEDEHDRSKRQLETAYEELQSTVEELETTNEELHSTNEELETTNEELQSSNEELETMNEELKSTNDELEVMNEDQAARTGELDRANMFLEGILASLGVGVVVVDRELNVQVWNANSEDMWGLRSDEVEGRPLMSLDVGFAAAELVPPLQRMLADAKETELTMDATSRRGKPVRCRVRLQPLRQSNGDTYGALLLMEASPPTGE
jgi:two-component system, chemotaxis family, CheB/CheR fusion protein